ncbi:MAG: phosphatidylglycerophosphatase A [Flavobacteriales bacterium]|jgi:phosphatidylglycerophosphatase A|nr:MAG: phosphatidylglycerophosphatase A [Flavobacteriales bacterium]
MERATPRVISIPSLIAGVLGIGYIGRGGGTVAAAVLAVLWAVAGVHALPPATQLAGIAALFALGTWAAGRMERGWGKDSRQVVVDEFAGMALALFALPAGWPAVLAAFVLFRVFDIAKPLGIARLERLPGGWGVMADDLLAGLYANLIMQAVVRTNLWTWL